MAFGYLFEYGSVFLDISFSSFEISLHSGIAKFRIGFESDLLGANVQMGLVLIFRNLKITELKYLERIRIFILKIPILLDLVQIFCIQTIQMNQEITKNTHSIQFCLSISTKTILFYLKIHKSIK